MRWYVCKIYELIQAKYEIIELLGEEYNIKSMCELLKVSRSGYYRWLNKKKNNLLNNYEQNRKDLEELIIEIHNKKRIRKS